MEILHLKGNSIVSAGHIYSLDVLSAQFSRLLVNSDQVLKISFFFFGADPKKSGTYNKLCDGLHLTPRLIINLLWQKHLITFLPLSTETIQSSILTLPGQQLRSVLLLFPVLFSRQLVFPPWENEALGLVG